MGREGRGRCRSYRRRSRDGQNGGYARESGRETRRPASACSERTSAHERRGRGGRRQRGNRPGRVAAGRSGPAGQQRLGQSAVPGRARRRGTSEQGSEQLRNLGIRRGAFADRQLRPRRSHRHRAPGDQHQRAAGRRAGPVRHAVVDGAGVGGPRAGRDARVVLHDRSARRPVGGPRERAAPDAGQPHRAVAGGRARGRFGAGGVQRPDPASRQRCAEPRADGRRDDARGLVGGTRSHGYGRRAGRMGQPGEPRDASRERARLTRRGWARVGGQHGGAFRVHDRSAVVLPGVRRRRLVSQPGAAGPSPAGGGPAHRQPRACPGRLQRYLELARVLHAGEQQRSAGPGTQRAAVAVGAQQRRHLPGAARQRPRA